MGDKARLNQLARARKAPTPRPVTPKPLVVAENTWVIRGKDGTYLGFAFGDGRQVRQLNLYDHLPADRVPHLGNYIINLTGILPDAIGIDIGAAIGADLRSPMGSSGLSAMGGINIIVHTRGQDAWSRYPEVHLYYGHSASFTMGTVLTSFSSILAPNASAAIQVILAWATTYDKFGRSKPAPSSWIANGFNWTGTFWSTGLSIPVYGKYVTLVGSYFQSVELFNDQKLVNTTVWSGISVGVGVSGKFKINTPFFKLDLGDATKLISQLKNIGINQATTEYGMVYGNGGDFIPAEKSPQKKKINIDGGHWPGINQNNYP
ncbi:hypothetical protein [Hymenobacter terrenus]|uniref:hypothetical protein n=1 Tax=Hymenobacter terrenus TaxID=1629124 RepID=UPI000B33636B|nr:hypothetical protein [Hymenobacter terrenus]